MAVEDRDWTEDFHLENGNYFCTCMYCGCQFSGHKRRVVCKKCAANHRAPEPGNAEVERLRKLAESIINRVSSGRKSSIGSFENTYCPQIGTYEVELWREALSSAAPTEQGAGVVTDFKILEICTAYEQGFGHAHRDLTNPYAEGSDGYKAWDFGKKQGESRTPQPAEPEAGDKPKPGEYGAICPKCGGAQWATNQYFLCLCKNAAREKEAERA